MSKKYAQYATEPSTLGKSVDATYAIASEAKALARALQTTVSGLVISGGVVTTPVDHIQEAGGNSLAVGAVADGEYLKRSGSTLIGDAGHDVGTNVVLGSTAGAALTTGTNNVAGGREALAAGTDAASNTALGYRALATTVHGNSNVAVGEQALEALAGDGVTTGINNVAVGYQAGHACVTGVGNVFIGHRSGVDEVGDYKLYIAYDNGVDPLVYGDFVSQTLEFNAATTVDGTLSVTGNCAFYGSAPVAQPGTFTLKGGASSYDLPVGATAAQIEQCLRQLILALGTGTLNLVSMTNVGT